MVMTSKSKAVYESQAAEAYKRNRGAIAGFNQFHYMCSRITYFNFANASQSAEGQQSVVASTQEAVATMGSQIPNEVVIETVSPTDPKFQYLVDAEQRCSDYENEKDQQDWDAENQI